MQVTFTGTDFEPVHSYKPVVLVTCSLIIVDMKEIPIWISILDLSTGGKTRTDNKYYRDAKTTANSLICSLLVQFFIRYCALRFLFS